MGAVAQSLDQGRISFERTSDSTLVMHLSGPWRLQRDLPPISLLLTELGSRPGIKRLSYETAELTHWDSGLVSFLTEVGEICRQRGIKDDREGLPAGLRRLIELAEAVPEKEGRAQRGEATNRSSRGSAIGPRLQRCDGRFPVFFRRPLGGVGASFVRGKARYRTVDLMEVDPAMRAASGGHRHA